MTECPDTARLANLVAGRSSLCHGGDAVTGATLKHLLEHKLEAMFPEDFTRRRVRKILGGYGREAREPEPDRVRLAILKLAGAALRPVEKFTGYAREDYRNILAWA